MGRFYVVTFENKTVVAAVDLVTIPGVANKTLRIHRCWFGHGTSTLAAAQGLRVLCKHLGATVTLGTGGSYAVGTITPSKLDQNDAACSLTTARTNDSTDGGGSRSSTSGTSTNILATGVHLFQGFDHDFGGRVQIASGTAFVMGLEAAVSGTVTLSGGVLLEEV
jgi:hypothetical protein